MIQRPILRMRKTFFQILMYGCIPVILSSKRGYSSWLLKGSSLSLIPRLDLLVIVHPPSHIASLVGRLRNMPAHEIIKRQKYIQRHAPLMQYNIKTALSTTLLGQPRCPLEPQQFWSEDALTMILEFQSYRSSKGGARTYEYTDTEA